MNDLNNNKGVMCVSLDFELYWGMSDVVTPDAFRENIKTTKEQVIPGILRCFERHGIHATWAAVGGIMAHDTAEYFKYAPSEDMRPTYSDMSVSSYSVAASGDLEDMFYYPDVFDTIRGVANQELGSHTFSHYYCTEPGQTLEQFSADLDSAVAISKARGIEPASIIFPRNQIDESYIRVCGEKGFKAYRSIEDNWIYNNVSFTPALRALRLLDSFFNLSGSNTHAPATVGTVVNIPGSRLFRPYSPKLAFLEGLKLRRIKKQMLYAAKHGEVFHLWWHPHNFSTHTDRNLANLEEILNYYEFLNDKYGFESLNMGEIADRIRSI